MLIYEIPITDPAKVRRGNVIDAREFPSVEVKAGEKLSNGLKEIPWRLRWPIMKTHLWFRIVM